MDRPVGPEVIAAARRGEAGAADGDEAAPREWFPDEMRGLDLLCLASGGGQQAPTSPRPARASPSSTTRRGSSHRTARRRARGAELTTVRRRHGRPLAFADESFDLVFHPVSNLFVPDVRPVWREAFRVLRRGGLLLAGFKNPSFYLFDDRLEEERHGLKFGYKVPYSDLDEPDRRAEASLSLAYLALEFGHTLDRPNRRTDRRRLSPHGSLRGPAPRPEIAEVHPHLRRHARAQALILCRWAVTPPVVWLALAALYTRLRALRRRFPKGAG